MFLWLFFCLGDFWPISVQLSWCEKLIESFCSGLFFVFCFLFCFVVLYSARQPAGNYFQTCLLEHGFISFVEQILLLPHPFLKCCPVLLRSFSVLLRTRHAEKLTFKIATNSLSLLCHVRHWRIVAKVATLPSSV